MKYKIIFIFFCFSFIMLPADNPKESYNITWVRPYKAGQTFFIRENLKVISHTSSLLNKVEISGQKTVRDLYYDSKVTVMEIGNKIIPTREKHEVIAFYELKLGQKIKLLEKGTTLIINKTDKGKEILMNEKPPEKEILQDLNQIIEMNTGGPTYNEIFGEVKKVKPGGDWNILKQNIIDSYKANKIIIDPTAINGKCSFEKVEGSKLYFNGTFVIDPFAVNVAKNHKLLNSKYTYSLYEVAPIDENKLPTKVTKIAHHFFSEAEIDKSDMEFTTDIEKEHTVKYFETEKEMSE